MPELAEVEYFRKQWNPGVGRRVTRVALHAGKRVLRGITAAAATRALTGTTLLGSEARAKQMLFRFGRGTKSTAWLGLHLGMTGKLSAETAKFTPGKHDHLVLFQREHALIFTDARQFGRVRLHVGAEEPEWWSKLPPDVVSDEFTLDRLEKFLQRRGGTAIKAVMLMQDLFPGVGNWMADEILWRSRIDPRRPSRTMKPAQTETIWKESRYVCTVALETIGEDFSDPPDDWFFHVRWTGKGHCPRCDLQIKTATVGGRTTRWCGRCQK